ncbi:site-2 protease family protein [bacterium DOLZORAL124_64_63]|nr:MAG: site-2 protease family protein [bacterium DOLZORAL124_64_63]
MDAGTVLVRIGVLVFSVVFHEVAHGWAAHKLGDPTARDMGRLTLNPLPHVDLFGSIVLPLVLALTGSPIMLGWAKPVPVRVGLLRDPDNDHPKVAAAGPASNLLLALICSLLLGLLLLVLRQVGNDALRTLLKEGGALHFLAMVLEAGILLNVMLALFNLVPLPPLDGSWILSRLLPPSSRAWYENLRRYGMLPVIVFLLALNYTSLGDYFMMALLRVYGLFFSITYGLGAFLG